MKWIKTLFCKHYYLIIEDKFDEQAKRQLNVMGYHSMKSKCRLCDYEKNHD